METEIKKKLNIEKTVNEAKNRCILYKGGKLPKEAYSEKDYKSDNQLIEYYNNIKHLV